MAQKIHSISIVADKVLPYAIEYQALDNDYKMFYVHAQKEYQKVPNLKGMSGMDAVAILENLGIYVELNGNGKVKEQSVAEGTEIHKVKKIVLQL